MKQLVFAENDLEAEIILGIPAGTRRGFARDLRRLQKGESPLAYRPLPEFGPGVGELKRGAFRIVYTTEFADETAVATWFRKDSKSGKKMRPEHRRQIERGLSRMRAGRTVAESAPSKLH